jgi:hypothetical protein
MILADSTPQWAPLFHPAASGYALVTDDTDVAWDLTPVWEGDHTWDDGAGDSPALVLIGGSNDDTARIFLADDAVAGDSDLVMRLVDDAGDSHLIVQNASASGVLELTSAGNIIHDIDDTWIGRGAASLRLVWNNSDDQAELRDGDFVVLNEGSAMRVDTTATRAQFSLQADGGAVNPDDRFVFQHRPDQGDTVLTVYDDSAAVFRPWMTYEYMLSYASHSPDLIVGNTGQPRGTVEIDQSAAGGALPCLFLDQGDISEQHIIVSENSADNEMDILEVDVTGTPTWGWNEANDRFFQNKGLGLTAGNLDIASTYGITHADDANGDYLRLSGGLYVPGDIQVGDIPAALFANPTASVGLVAVNGVATTAMRSDAAPPLDQNIAPTWTGIHVHANRVDLDDGAGNSPALRWLGGTNNDTAEMFLLEAGVAGDSSVVLDLCDDADSQFRIRNNSNATVAYVQATGAADFASVTVDQYVYHDGDADTLINFQADRITLEAGGVALLDLVEAGTDYVLFGAQADLNGNDLIIDTDGDTYLHESADDVVSLAIAGNEQYDWDATEMTFSKTDGTEVLWIRAHGDVIATGADFYASANGGFAADDSLWMFIDANASGTDAQFVIAKDAETTGAATALMRVTEAPLVFLNETANADMTIGLTINQGANDDEIIAVKSSDVAHGMTDFAETDTYGQLSKNNASYGGLRVRGFRDDSSAAANWGAANFVGYLGEAADTTKTTSGRGVVEITSAVKSGTGITDVGSDGNLMVIRNNTTTRFIFDAEGSAHADIEWIAFSEHNDLALLDALEASFGEFADDHRHELERLRIAQFDDRPGHAMVNWTRLTMLLVGAIRQNRARQDRAFAALGLNPALLEGAT